MIRRMLDALLVVAILAVPLCTLAWVYAWRSNVPEPQEWRQALGEAPLRVGWDHLFEFEGEPNRVGFRLLYEAALATPNADFKRLALLGWGLALVTCILVALVARRSNQQLARSGRCSARGLFALLLLALCAFSPRFGSTFLLDTRFRVFVPAACLVAGSLLLSGTRSGAYALRFSLALLLAQLALFTERTGVLVWIVLVPLVWQAGRRSTTVRPIVPVVLWCVAGNLGIALCNDEPAASAAFRSGLLGNLETSPLDTTLFFLKACAHGVPDPLPGVPIAAPLLGAGLLVAFLIATLCVLARRTEPGMVTATLPFLAFAAYGIGCALLSAENDYPPAIADSLLRELAFGSLFLPIGVAGALALAAPRSAVVLRVLAPMLLLAVVQDWVRALPVVLREHRVLLQGEALLAFSNVGAKILPRAPRPPLASSREVEELRARGLLRTVIPVRSLELGELAQTATDPGEVVGALLTIDKTTARGLVQDLPTRAAPELVLLTRKSGTAAERVFAIAAPDLLAAGPGFPWVAEFAETEPFRPDETVRAWGFELAARRLVALPTPFLWQRDGFVAAPGASK